jgi:hypothetical protein
MKETRRLLILLAVVAVYGTFMMFWITHIEDRNNAERKSWKEREQFYLKELETIKNRAQENRNTNESQKIVTKEIPKSKLSEEKQQVHTLQEVTKIVSPVPKEEKKPVPTNEEKKPNEEKNKISTTNTPAIKAVEQLKEIINLEDISSRKPIVVSSFKSEL